MHVRSHQREVTRGASVSAVAPGDGDTLAWHRNQGRKNLWRRIGVAWVLAPP